MSYAVSPTMSDDERDIDIESDEDDQQSYSRNSGQYPNQVDKRAHHNALERKRRDHIKDSFSSLRDSVPSLHGEKASRAQILKKAADYIQFMRRKNVAHQQDIEDLKKQNDILLSQIRSLEKAKSMGCFGESGSGLVTPPGEREAGQESDHSDDGRPKGKRTKKTKFAA